LGSLVFTDVVGPRPLPSWKIQAALPVRNSKCF
jgi:hypothetical protein